MGSLHTPTTTTTAAPWAGARVGPGEAVPGGPRRSPAVRGQRPPQLWLSRFGPWFAALASEHGATGVGSASPAALELGELCGPAPSGCLQWHPRPSLGRALSRKRIAAAIRAGRQRHVRKERPIQGNWRHERLARLRRPERRPGRLGGRPGRRHRELNTQVARLEEQLAAVLDQHPDARSSDPCQDWGRSWAPGCSASSGTARTATPC